MRNLRLHRPVLLALAVSVTIPCAFADQVVYFVNGKAMIVKSVEKGDRFTVLEMDGGGRMGVPTEQIVRIEEYVVSQPSAPPAAPAPTIMPVVLAPAPAGGAPVAASAQPPAPVAPIGTQGGAQAAVQTLPGPGIGGRATMPNGGVAGLQPLSIGGGATPQPPQRPYPQSAGSVPPPGPGNQMLGAPRRGNNAGPGQGRQFQGRQGMFQGRGNRYAGQNYSAQSPTAAMPPQAPPAPAPSAQQAPQSPAPEEAAPPPDDPQNDPADQSPPQEAEPSGDSSGGAS